MFKNDDTSHYFLLTPEEIALKEIIESPLKSKDYRKVHMICFLPDGSVETKVSICSCNSCMEDNFISCTTEKGKEYNKNMSNDIFLILSFNEELHEIRAEYVTSIISKNLAIALYSSTDSFKLFYLCKVIDFQAFIQALLPTAVFHQRFSFFTVHLV